ncbi:MAG: hypothetical protein J6386_17025 [Candidatus Synoicihabitans palmerolidicus]|nr:hypothetical protein [Candidatus Synoicihabitans palmerolidicus]
MVDTASREETREFYLALYGLSEGVPSGWTGNTTSGEPGTTSAAFKEAVRNRVNFYRVLGGVPANISIQHHLLGQSPQAALMMSANNALAHSPPTS